MIFLEFSSETGFQNTFCCFVRFGIAPKSQNRRHLTKHLSQYFQNKGSVTEPGSLYIEICTQELVDGIGIGGRRRVSFIVWGFVLKSFVKEAV